MQFIAHIDNDYCMSFGLIMRVGFISRFRTIKDRGYTRKQLILNRLICYFNRNNVHQLIIIFKIVYQIIFTYIYNSDNFIMDIKEQYIINHKIGSFSQYKVPREEYDARNSIMQLSQSKSPKATGNFVNIIQKSAKQTPGPGQYSITKQIPTLQVKKPSKINFQKLQAKGTTTYLDSLIKQKSKIPDVGKYQILIDKTKQIREKYQKKGDNDRKNAPLFRPTILDQINRDTIKVSPSIYEVTKPMGYKSVGGGIQPEHRRTLSLPKLPGSADYRPIPVSYTTFDAKKKQGKAGKNKGSTFGSRDNKKSQSLGPGPKYNLISAWVETKNKYGQKKNRNLFKSLSSLRSPSIYH